MLRQDRATKDFLSAFPDDAKELGRKLHDEGCVNQIYGNHILIEGRVAHDGQEFRTALKLTGNEWIGFSDDVEGVMTAPVYATMLARIQRGDTLPAAPPAEGSGAGEQTIYEFAEERLGRPVEPDEEVYLGKIEKRYRRWEATEEIYDTDIVRLNSSWEIEGYDPLTLWPSAPTSILEFWNYLAWAFEKAKIGFPKFMRPLTDLDSVQAKLEVWERQRELADWNEKISMFNSAPPEPGRRAMEFRLLVTTDDVKLQARSLGDHILDLEDDDEEEGDEHDAENLLSDDEEVDPNAFATISTPAEYAEIAEALERGELELSPESELVLRHFQHQWNEEAKLEIDLREPAGGRLLSQLFHQPLLHESLVNLDELPFELIEGELSWTCVETEDEAGHDIWEIRLLTPQGEPVPHSLRLLPGPEPLYLSDDCIFKGPDFWTTESTEVFPVHELQPEIIETGSGVEFLSRLGASLPDSLQSRVRERPMQVTLKLELRRRSTSAESEHMMATVTAADPEEERVEHLDKEGWQVVSEPDPESDSDALYRYDRSSLFLFPTALDELRASYDQGLKAFKIRITKAFPERFGEWIARLPDTINVEPDDELKTLLDEPVSGSIRFEINESENEIDWFDIKVAIDVEGHVLSKDEIKALVAARGGYVRVKGKGWLRLKLQMADEAKEAIERLGLDVYDLSGKTHRMHALQLADPDAKEVFDEKAWEDVSARASNLKLKVQPTPSPELLATLRPYQIEGFHFLSYLASNNFGGILADDMGLGKTIQSLCWILWLRDKSEETQVPPALVVAPKSVLDVWAAEIEKFSPHLTFQVLRNKEELDIDHVAKEIDVLIINYAQLRSCIEQLQKVCWIAAILDEGQQIKNPDSKAAKASRQIEAENRLVLSGTPIENRLLDVWSLMAFAMPGVLGDRAYFRERFDRRKDPVAQKRLTSRLRPFLLRRTKNQVAVDLPPKVEEDVLCKMDDLQEKLYNEELMRAQANLLDVGEDGAKKNSFAVLQALMRLRQICCHPALIDDKYHDAESAKMEALFYLLDQLQQEGHKALVFSQFTSLLSLIEERLDDEDRPYHLLTGKTENRSEVVRNFQKSKEPDVFLLSLKAGGSGLNLTAASYVILFDPWWNPAVEAQAIDRTHRIGQTNKVNAYRLITRDTVEEKIRALQAKKQEMVQGVLGGETNFANNLDLKDLRFLLGEGSA